MLNNIPKGINRATRNNVIRHPNSNNCQIFRPSVNRSAPDEVGGMPTMGGMGVLSFDDEEDVAWAFVGNGYVLQVDGFSPAQMTDRQDANNGFQDEFRFLLEPESEVPEAYPQKHDVVMVLITTVVRLAFEIVAIETTSNIPPYTQRYVCNRRADLNLP